MSDIAIAGQRIENRRRRRYSVPSRGHLAGGIGVIEGLAAFLIMLLFITFVTRIPLQPLTIGISTIAGIIYAGTSTTMALRYLARLDPREPVLVKAMAGWSFAYGCGLAIVVLTGDVVVVSPKALVVLFVGGLALLSVLRGAIYLRLTGMMTLGRLQLERVAVVGMPQTIGAFLTTGQIWRQGAQVVKTFEFDTQAETGLESVSAFAADCIQANCQHVIFVGDLSDLGAMERIAAEFKRFALDVTFAPAPSTASTRLLDISPLGPHNGIKVVKRPMGLRARLTKRAFDLLASSAGIVLLSPLLALVAIAIKLDSPGPVLYRQARRGFNGESFSITKFRSMSVLEDGHAMTQAKSNDPRVTRVGRFIRRTSIDELPQLFDVFAGTMSLVGPRPHAISHDAELSAQMAEYAHRQRVKPGITGWAQVNGYRGDTSTFRQIEGRTLHDLYYIENWSLLFDIWIVLLTVFSPKTRSNAY